jgi:ribonuclease HI
VNWITLTSDNKHKFEWNHATKCLRIYTNRGHVPGNTTAGVVFSKTKEEYNRRIAIQGEGSSFIGEASATYMALARAPLECNIQILTNSKSLINMISNFSKWKARRKHTTEGRSLIVHTWKQIKRRAKLPSIHTKKKNSISLV